MTLASAVARDQHLVLPRPVIPYTSVVRRNTANTTIASVTITAGSSGAKGAWTQLIASTEIEASEIILWVDFNGVSGSNRAKLLDLSIGDGSQNPVRSLVENMVVGAFMAGSGIARVPLRVPLRIPQGVEIIARTSCPVNGATVPVSTELVGGLKASPSFTSCVTYGADESTERGTELAAPASANTWGAWTEITAATTQPIYQMGVGFNGPNNNTWTSASNFIEVGYGGAGSEVSLYSGIYFTTLNSETLNEMLPMGHIIPVLTPLPAGTRIAARHHCTITTQQVNLLIHGYF